MVNHELKSPLTAIRGWAQLAQRRGEQLERAWALEVFGEIVHQTDLLLVLIDNLSNPGALERGALRVDRRPTPLRPLLLEIVRNFEASTGGARRVQLDLAPVLPVVSVDAMLLRGVLSNLLTNAAKYSEADAEILLSARTEPGWVRVDVTDHGMGIAPDEIGRLFDALWRAESTVGRPGMGLGLTIARAVVEAHGGRIWASSPGRGRGSTFTFTLPVDSGARASSV